MESKFIKNSNNVKIHTVNFTSGEIPVVLSHGFKDNWETMLPIAKRLPKEYSPVLYDAKAHGLSEAPDNGYSSKDMAMDIAAICKKLYLDNPILMGHSMGATSSLIASNIIDTRKLILEDPAGKISKQIDYDNIEEELESIRLKDISSLEKYHKKTNPNFPSKYYRILALARKQIRPEIINICNRGYPSIEEIISNKNIPETLLLRPDPNIVDYCIEDNIKNSKINRKIIPNSGHTIFRDCPEKFTLEVEKFLKK